jgi:hypothetical protein
VNLNHMFSRLWAAVNLARPDNGFWSSAMGLDWTAQPSYRKDRAK